MLAINESVNRDKDLATAALFSAGDQREMDVLVMLGALIVCTFLAEVIFLVASFLN